VAPGSTDGLTAHPDDDPAPGHFDAAPSGAAVDPDPAAARPDRTARQLPAHRSAAEVEAAFASIVAGFDSDRGPADAPWPAAESLVDERTEPPTTRGVQRWRSSTINPYDDQDDGTLLDALDTFGADLPDDENDRYIPPPPPPLPHFSANAILGTLAVVIGLLLILAPRILPVSEQNARTLGFVSVVGGAGALIWRLRSDRDDNDDGARI
jgi:hypothetical protein